MTCHTVILSLKKRSLECNTVILSDENKSGMAYHAVISLVKKNAALHAVL